MRWWIAAILVIVCVVIGMLIPLPSINYDSAFMPAESTSQPLPNIGLMLKAPEPASESGHENNTETYLYNQEVNDGYVDARLGSLPYFPLDGDAWRDESLRAVVIDMISKQWNSLSFPRANRANLLLDLEINDMLINIIDVASGTVVYEIDTNDLCETPATIDWAQDRHGRIAVCVGDENGQNASTLLYELLTNDITVFENFANPRFSLDENSLYMLEQSEVPALYCSTPPSGEPKRITAEGFAIHSQQPVTGGVLVRGYEVVESEEEEKLPFLLYLDYMGETLEDYEMSSPVDSASDYLFPVSGGHAYMTASGTITLIDINSNSMFDMENGDVPIALLKDMFLVRNGGRYLVRNKPGGEVTAEITLAY